MDISPELALKAYAFGVFPMARSREDKSVVWVQPKLRGVLPLYGFHASRSLRKVLRRGEFTVTCDTAFHEVMDGCAEPGPGRDETWINDTIVRLFTELHQAGLAHSIEVWRTGELVGGLYGLAMGAAFFGESMFSRTDNASKVALCHLVGILRRGNFALLDAQFMTDHLRQFGAIEVTQQDYLGLLSGALERRGRFQGPLAPEALLAELSQAKTQTS
ncbi:MAG: leucyl/phenylalanyl-tRNA--protein transferase [Alphaproteobacteria bacterium]|nr:leucyl/phenylalanyl-tRNA--protein transferase [Alphaproteobacteria bacterium]